MNAEASVSRTGRGLETAGFTDRLEAAREDCRERRDVETAFPLTLKGDATFSHLFWGRVGWLA